MLLVVPPERGLNHAADVDHHEVDEATDQDDQESPGAKDEDGQTEIRGDLGVCRVRPGPVRLVGRPVESREVRPEIVGVG